MVSRLQKLGLTTLLALCTPLFWAGESYALLTTETTLSTGYYRDIEQRARIPALFYWTLNHTAANRVETIVDLGVNNDVNPAGAWRVYLYGARMDIPAGNAHFLLGRQLFTEGFELSTFDGVLIPFRILPWLTITPIAGINSTVDNLEPEARSRSVGASVSGTVAAIDWKAGYLNKSKPGERAANLVHVGALHDFDSLPWTPLLFGRLQWDLSPRSFDQSILELQLHPTPRLQFGLTYSDRRPNLTDTASQDWIYRLFATSSRREYGASASWSLTPVVTAQLAIEEYRFNSPAKADSANEQQFSLNFRSRAGSSIEPFLAHIASYGGNVYQFGARGYLPVYDRFELRGLLDVAKIEKLNGITGWAHHARAGMGFRMSSRFLAQAVLEVERNHRFELETRAIAYVSHFYY